MGRKFIDLAGRKYNYLVITRMTRKIGKRYYYECVCVCGRKKILRGDNVKSGHTKSCGCLTERNSDD